MHLFLYI